LPGHKLSISRAWDESKAIVARNGGLLVTIALALFVLPGVISDMVSPPTKPGELPPIGYWSVIAALAVMVSLIGQLAVVRLATAPGVAVGEAIAHGARRVPAYVAATLLWIAPFAILLALLAPRLVSPNADPVSALAVLLAAIAGIYVAIRLLLTSAVASEENANPIRIIKRSWTLTGGNFWRLFAFFMMFLIAAGVTLMAVGAIAGVISAAVFGDSGPMTVGGLLISMLSQLFGAAVTILLMLMIARIYLQAAGAGAAEPTVPNSGT
jgi:hypothetical protein